ncbi:MAG: DUF4410 domain-containing protein [Verrucomicrobiota bacterium]
MKIKNTFLFLTGVLLISSCASVKVDDKTVEYYSQLEYPKKIYVSQFDTAKGIWDVDRSGSELSDFKKNASAELQFMMVERFREIAPTSNTPKSLPGSGMLVKGEFKKINQGSRALRMGIGFGAGGTKVEALVKIYNLAKSKTKPAVSFRTTGGSNAQPGLIAGGLLTAPIFAAANSTGLTSDWERTSREVRNFILNNADKK